MLINLKKHYCDEVWDYFFVLLIFMVNGNEFIKFLKERKHKKRSNARPTDRFKCIDHFRPAVLAVGLGPVLGESGPVMEIIAMAMRIGTIFIGKKAICSQKMVSIVITVVLVNLSVFEMITINI